jgi:hypothetical protein
MSWTENVDEDQWSRQAPSAPDERDRWDRAQTVTEITIDEEGRKMMLIKKVLKTEKQRPVTMVDLRAKLPKFGEGLVFNKDLVAKDPPMVLELSKVDPIFRAARDEVVRLWGEVERAAVDVSGDPALLKYAKQLAAPTPAPAKTEEKPSAAPAASSDSKMTWEEMRAQKKAAAAEKATGGAGGAGSAPSRAVDTQEEIKHSVIRISNLADHISETEIRRLFGPEGGLGRIVKLFIAKDGQDNRKGFAYVYYGSDEDGIKAVQKMRRTAFKNTIMTVDFGTVKPPRAGGGGGGGGRGRGDRD